MLIGKKRIEEDLEVFRRAVNTPPGTDGVDPEPQKETPDEKVAFSDFIALCWAALSIVLPWVIGFGAAIGVVGWLLVMWLG